jgi:dUTP pyrophosphatase
MKRSEISPGMMISPTKTLHVLTETRDIVSVMRDDVFVVVGQAGHFVGVTRELDLSKIEQSKLVYVSELNLAHMKVVDDQSPSAPAAAAELAAFESKSPFRHAPFRHALPDESYSAIASIDPMYSARPFDPRLKGGIFLKFKKLHPGARTPTYATPGAACFDIHALDTSNPEVVTDYWLIQPQKSTNLPTGLAFEIPPGHVMLVYPRSGLAFKSNTRLGNCVAVIDSDFRGELRVMLHNDSLDTACRINDGDRIAQAMIIPVPCVELCEVDELSSTERGSGGLGSTGK